jgi:uncharacterized Fe-S cluster protein YjdI
VNRVQSYTAPGITVTFDPKVCIHSAVCLSALPAVFDVQRRRWIRPEAASVAEVTAAIDRCPSGALQYVLENQAEAAASPRDEEVETRCGATGNQPFCDGSHRRVGFQSRNPSS